MQPQTVTLIVAVLGKSGTFRGIGVGHLLSCSWQREQWCRDKRNEEFREMLQALAESYRIQLTLHAGAVLGPDEEMAIVESQSKAMAVIRSRIFIAEVVHRYQVELAWAQAVRNHGHTLDVAPLAEAFATISAKLVEAATKGIPDSLD